MSVKPLVMKVSEHRCLLYSVAMILGTSVQELETAVGHRGDPPKGHHFVEFIKPARSIGYTLCYVPVMPVNISSEGHHPVYTQVQARQKLEDWLAKNYCVILGKNKRGVGHAVAWFRTHGIDPSGGDRFTNPYALLDIEAILIRF